MTISTVSLDMIQGSLFTAEFVMQSFNGTSWVPEDLTGVTFEFKIADCEGVDNVVLITGQASPDGEITLGPAQGVIQVKVWGAATIGLESSTWALWRNPAAANRVREGGGRIDYHKELQP